MGSNIGSEGLLFYPPVCASYTINNSRETLDDFFFVCFQDPQWVVSNFGSRMRCVYMVQETKEAAWNEIERPVCVLERIV